MGTILKKIRHFFNSIKWRLVATYVLVMLITLSLVTVYILKLVSEYTFNDRSVDLMTKANILANFAAESDLENNTNTKPMRSALEIVGDSRVMYLDKDTKVLFDTSAGSNLVGKTMPVQQVADALLGQESAVKTQEEDRNYLDVAVPVSKNGEITGVIFLQSPADEMVDFFAHIRQNLLMLSGVICIIVGLLSFAFSNALTAPLMNMAAKIREMSQSRTKKAIDIGGSNEVNELVTQFNKMIEEINVVEARRQQFVSNASHELKTPLSSVKLICDSILQNPDVGMDVVNEFLFDMNDEVDRLTRITNKLLSLTKMDASAEESEMIELSVINIKGLVRRIVKALRPLAESKHIEIETLLTEDIFVTVDADKLWEAIYNIAENSIKYTADGGWVYVETYRDKQEVYITVADNGIGMEEEETEKIFDRFYRVDKARARETGGTGLGLSIARSSIELHGGSIFVESREGVGSLFRIIIPTVAVQSTTQEE